MIIQHLRMAFNSLRSNKTRTFLTLLGIIIGVMSVTTIIGLGEGVKKQVNQQINDLGNDLVTVIPGRNSSISGLEGLNNVFGSSATTARLSEADLTSISKIAGVTKAGGTMQLDGSITRGNNKKYTSFGSWRRLSRSDKAKITSWAVLRWRSRKQQHRCYSRQRCKRSIWQRRPYRQHRHNSRNTLCRYRRS